MHSLTQSVSQGVKKGVDFIALSVVRFETENKKNFEDILRIHFRHIGREGKNVINDE